MMRIEKEVYPPLGENSKIMLRAGKSLLKNMETYLLQSPELQFLLQCAWILGFGEVRKTKAPTLKEEILNETRSPDSET